MFLPYKQRYQRMFPSDFEQWTYTHKDKQYLYTSHDQEHLTYTFIHLYRHLIVILF